MHIPVMRPLQQTCKSLIVKQMKEGLGKHFQVSLPIENTTIYQEKGTGYSQRTRIKVHVLAGAGCGLI
jgi:hypothetical protein